MSEEQDQELFGCTVKEERFRVGKQILLLREPSAMATKEIKHLIKKHVMLLVSAENTESSRTLALMDLVTECVDDVAAIVFDVEENRETLKMDSPKLRAWVREHLALGAQATQFIGVLFSMVNIEDMGKQMGALQEKLVGRVQSAASPTAEQPQTAPTSA